MSSSPHERATGHRLSKSVTSSSPRRPPSHGQSSVTADLPALRVACKTTASADKRDRIDDQDRSCRAAVVQPREEDNGETEALLSEALPSGAQTPSRNLDDDLRLPGTSRHHPGHAEDLHRHRASGRPDRRSVSGPGGGVITKSPLETIAHRSRLVAGVRLMEMTL